MKKLLLSKRLVALLCVCFLLSSSFAVSLPLPAAAASTPSLIITELCANSRYTDTDGQDAYEYIEIKNTGTSSVNLLNYKFKLYTSDADPVNGTAASLLRTWTLPTKTLAAGGVMVIWLQTVDTPIKTLAAFNAHYGTSLTTSQIIMLDLGTAGLGNTGYRKLVLQNASNADICYAKYNEGTGDDANASYDTGTGADKTTIVYEFREYPIPTYKAMFKLASWQTPTPGVVGTPPSIWITEIMANPATSPTDTNDAYEHIELYNNTGSTINLAGYKIIYYATDTTTYTWNFPDTETINLPAYGYKTIWIYSDAYSSGGLAEFNEHYDVSLTSDQLYILHSYDHNLPNTGKRAVALCTDAGTQICKATYNDPVDGDAGYQDKSILYEKPLDNTTNMRKVAVNQDPTPCELYNLLYGQLHAHSTASDGSGTAWATSSTGDGSPTEAYSAVKAAGADYFSLTDHSNYFDDSGANRWNTIRQTAYANNENNVFASLFGYEMTWSESTGWWGHMNTFNTSWWNSRELDTSISNMHADFDMLAGDPESISQFNHPVEKWGTFNDYEYLSAQADGVIPLIEATPSLGGYIRALDRGWHVAPTRNNDNHDQHWYVNDDSNPATTYDKMRTVILAPRATKDYIFDAIRNRRVYASQDTNLKIKYTVNGSVLGSRLTNPGTLNISVDVRDPDAGDNISKISVIANYGTVVASQTYSSNKVTFTTQLSPQYSYYFIKVEQADGDWAATAPVWIEDAPPVAVTMDAGPSADSSPAEVIASVQNTTTSNLSNILVEFYQTDVSAANKVGETTIASLAPGATSTAARTTSYTSGNYTIYAVVTAGGRKVTGKIVVPELLITELVINAQTDGGTGDAYEFMEIYNNTKSDINLSGYKLRYHFSCDDETTDYTDTDISASFVVPAKSTVLVWVKQSPESDGKTLANFKSFYGISSFPDSRILSISGGMSNTGSRIWYIMKDDETIIGKAWFNEGMDLGLDGDAQGEAVTYKYPTNGLQNYTKISDGQTPTPGTVVTSGSGKQVP